MKTMLRFSAALSAIVLSLTFVFGSVAKAQVSSFPYPYGFETGAAQSPITGDGNWSSQRSNGNGPSDWEQLATGGQSGGSAYLAGYSSSNKYSRLLVHLNTSAATFTGSEFWQFYIRRDSTGSVASDTSTYITIQYSFDGINFTNLSGPVALYPAYLPTGNEWVSEVYFLPDSLGGRSSVYLALTVDAGTGHSNRFDNLYVDDSFIGGGALPIQMASFAANVVRDNDVEVSWKTVSETNNYGFEIYRKRGETGEWSKIGFVEGHGTTLTPQAYSYSDRGVSFGKYYYRINQVDLDGQSKNYPEMEVAVGTGPEKFVLAQNYPNPFNPSTLIDFVVSQSGPATMKVYNLLGQEVATLFDGNADAARIYTARFNASNLPSGLYFYTLRSAGKFETKQMFLIK